MPPAYQPEVAADAIAWADDRGRRRTYVAASTGLTVWGNRLAPGLVARYLASGNIEAQQTEGAASQHAPDNLFEPQDQHDDHGARGRFGDEAHATSPAQFLSRNRGKTLAVVAAGMLGWWATRSRSAP